jgi:hypothetical protein
VWFALGNKERRKTQGKIAKGKGAQSRSEKSMGDEEKLEIKKENAYPFFFPL